MNLAADHAFHIGHQHLRGGSPCQDFALSGVFGGNAYAIVSDGCSTGGMTDVGARIVALRSRIDIEGGEAPAFDLSSLGVRTADLLATHVRVKVDPEGVSFCVEGDGAFAIRWEDGSISAVKVEWANNMPCYPVYAEDGFSRFIAAQGGDLSVPAMSWEQWDGTPASGMGKVAEGTLNLGFGLSGFTRWFGAAGLAHVAVFTDGVQQVEGMDWPEVIQNLMNFKTGAGEFAKRRMQRFLSDASKLGRGPQDDIAFAVVALAS